MSAQTHNIKLPITLLALVILITSSIAEGIEACNKFKAAHTEIELDCSKSFMNTENGLYYDIKVDSKSAILLEDSNKHFNEEIYKNIGHRLPVKRIDTKDNETPFYLFTLEHYNLLLNLTPLDNKGHIGDVLINLLTLLKELDAKGMVLDKLLPENFVYDPKTLSFIVIDTTRSAHTASLKDQSDFIDLLMLYLISIIDLKFNKEITDDYRKQFKFRVQEAINKIGTTENGKFDVDLAISKLEELKKEQEKFEEKPFNYYDPSMDNTSTNHNTIILLIVGLAIVSLVATIVVFFARKKNTDQGVSEMTGDLVTVG